MTVQPSPTADCGRRHDLYGPIHKGLRFALGALLADLGSTDFTERAEAIAICARLRVQMVLSASHLAHEEAHVHAALEARAPGSTGRLEAAHRHHDATFEEIATLLKAAECAVDAERAPIGRALYLRFSQFVAEDFAHMAEEEQITLPLLHSLFSDEELVGIEAAIVADIPPEKMMMYLRLMLPALSRPERAGFLAFMRPSAPPEVFQAVIEHAARPALHPEDFADLTRRLDLAA
jgi:hypothetical protein